MGLELLGWAGHAGSVDFLPEVAVRGPLGGGSQHQSGSLTGEGPGNSVNRSSRAGKGEGLKQV